VTVEIPAWLEAYAQECRVLFGLEVWDIVVRLVDRPGEEDGNEGHVTVNTRYLAATIELDRAKADDQAQMRRVVMHEMLHVAFAPISRAYLRTMDLLPKKALRRHAEQLYEDGIEETIERLTRALQKEIKPSAKEEG
jgi:hypothetical protein